MTDSFYLFPVSVVKVILVSIAAGWTASAQMTAVPHEIACPSYALSHEMQDAALHVSLCP